MALPMALRAGMAETVLEPYQCWFACSCSELSWVARNAGLKIESPVKILH